jgi:hypothetical protein
LPRGFFTSVIGSSLSMLFETFCVTDTMLDSVERILPLNNGPLFTDGLPAWARISEDRSLR